MGEARRRGTYEQRKVQALARQAEERRRLEEAQAQLEASLSPEDRAKRRRARTLLAFVAGLAASRL